MRKLRSGGAGLVNRTLAGAFRKWTASATGLGVARRAVLQLLGLQRARALRTWHLFATEEAAALSAVLRVEQPA